MSLLTPGLQSSLWPTPTFILGSLARLLTHFPLEPGCEDYAFLDQAVADLKQGLDSILTDSLKTLELDTSLEEHNALTSSVSSGFLHLVSTLSDNSKLQLAPSIPTHKLWCQARAPLAPVSLATKMSASKLIHYFSSHPAAFGFCNSFLISRLPWLILFPHCQRLREMLYLGLECVNFFSGFMAFWTRLFPSKLEIQHIF